MQSHGSYACHWAHSSDLIIGANFTVAPGGENSGFAPSTLPAAALCMPIEGMHYFAIDVLTDDLVDVEIQVGYDATALILLTTLVCPAVLQHNTVYDLPPPFNTDGFLVVSSIYMRLQVINNSGNVVSPFHLFAKVWS